MADDRSRPDSAATSRTLKRKPSKLDLNPFVIADRLTGAMARQPVVGPDMTESRSYSRLSRCVPTHGDIWLDLAKSHSDDLGRSINADEVRRPYQRVSSGTAPIGQQHTGQDSILRNRKQLSPGVNGLEGRGRMPTTVQPHRRRSMAFNTGESPNITSARTLSPLLAFQQGQQSVPFDRLADRLGKAGTRSSSYLAQTYQEEKPRHDHASAQSSETASVDYRSLLRPTGPRPYERLSPSQTSQTGYPADLKHYVPTGPGSLKKIPSSPAVLRRAPPLANLHSRHRSPNLPDDCGYCELDEVQGIMPISPVAIPEDVQSSNSSRLESYHTAESDTSSRQLRRIRESKMNLRSSASTSARSSRATNDQTPTTPSSAGTARPLGNMAGTSPQPEVQQPAPVRRSDHDCE